MTFEELKQFSKLIDQYKYPKTPALENTESKAYKLFKGLSEDRINSKEEAIQQILGNGASDGRYRVLKHELKEKLINTAVLMNPNYQDHTELGKEFIECNKLWAAMLIIIQMGDQKFAMDFGHSIYPRIKKSGFSDLHFLLAYKLKTNFSLINFNIKKATFYKKELELARNRLDAEVLARDAYNEFKIAYLTNQKTHHIKRLYNNYAPSLDEIPEINQTVIFKRFLYLFKSRYFEQSRNYKALKDFCYTSLNEVKGNTLTYIINMNLLKLTVIEKEFKIGQKIYLKFKKDFSQNFDIQFTINYYYTILSFFCKKYNVDKSLNEMRKIPKGSQFQYQIDALKILEAYDFLLKRIQNKKVNSPTFKLNKFLNEVPLLSKAKSGANISILIIQILILLVTGKQKLIIERVEALNQYCHRYLKNDRTLRSNCFIKMLIETTKAGFNKKRAERYALKYHLKLINAPMYLSIEIPEVEIIPYEDLWEMVLHLLD